MATTNVSFAPTTFSDHPGFGPALGAGQFSTSSAPSNGTRTGRKPQQLAPRRAPSMSPIPGAAQRTDAPRLRSLTPITAGAEKMLTHHLRARLYLLIPAGRPAPSRGLRVRTLAHWLAMPDPVLHAAPWDPSSHASVERSPRGRAVGRRTTRMAGRALRCVVIFCPAENTCARSLVILDSAVIARLP